MCGIIGYVGRRPSQEVLFSGLRRLEYRGYDSAGIAWRDNGVVHRVRSVGNLDALDVALAEYPVEETDGYTTSGIGHTRWATHGGVTKVNAHPHEDASGKIRIVLNGIIENYSELRRRHNIHCVSETDAEIVAHLISMYYDGNLSQAVRRSLDDLRGHYAFVAMSDEESGTLVGVRKECPLILGLGQSESFIASSIAAFRAYTKRVSVLDDSEIVVMEPERVQVIAQGHSRAPVAKDVDWDEDRAEKDGYETFMLKEIHEQPAAVAQTLSGYRSQSTPTLSTRLDGFAATAQRIVIVGCGTSYHAGLAGKLAIEQWTRVPVDVAIASEFRYANPIIAANTLVIGITQSGETADTLAAMRTAREQGAHIVALTNVVDSQATREADEVIYTRAGLEMGVAATKTFLAQITALYALALRIQHFRHEPSGNLEAELDALPGYIEDVIADCERPEFETMSRSLAKSPFFLYLGRLSGLPVALEGALKLKEISYIPTDAYAAGEMKHGPIALLSPQTPVVAVATEKAMLPKLLSNMAEVRARGVKVLAIATEGTTQQVSEHADWVFTIPHTDPILQIALAVIPLQLFAYHVARAKGLNVDQPRNLAKTVTVE